MADLSHVSILDAFDHASIWKPFFARNQASWHPWRVFLSALFGLPIEGQDLEFYHRCTGRTAPPPGGTTEAWLICGRRAGKSFILATIACFLATFKDWKPYLQPGEFGFIKVIATDRRQARVIYRYCCALLTKVPVLASMVERETDSEILLTNGVVIEIQTASFRSVRGATIIAALCDEIAFWRTEETSANPDSEILAALRPAMATIPGAMLLCASSPYARRGELWNAFRRHHGQDDAIPLVWKAATRIMNPSVPQRVLDEAAERDPANAAAEYGAEFRSDIAAFVPREVVEAATPPGRFELPPAAGVSYSAFVDPSGGSADSMTLAIAHRDAAGRAILDAIRERRPPFSPEAVVEEFAALLKDYRIARVTGDAYAGEWPREQFRKHGVDYQTSDRHKSAIYIEFLPLLNGGKAELLDVPRLAAQFIGLERRTTRVGRDTIDHAPSGHDDVANAAAGALVNATARAPIVISAAMLAQARQPPGRPLLNPR